MRRVQLGNHFADDVIEIRAVCDVRQFLFVSRFDRRPIQSPHGRVVVEVALYTPRFIEDLFPLGARIEFHLQSAEFNLAIADLLARPVVDDAEDGTSTIDNFVAGSINVIAADSGQQHRVFALSQIVGVQHPGRSRRRRGIP